MKAPILLATMAAGALCGSAMLTTAHAQVPAPGTLFVIHSAAQGACPLSTGISSSATTPSLAA